MRCLDPWTFIRKLTEDMRAATPATLPGGSGSFCGGWVGYGGYDTMRYAEMGSLPFEGAPADDRGLPDLHLGLYRDVVVFDHVAKVVFVVHWVDLAEHGGDVARAHGDGVRRLDRLTATLSRGEPLSPLRGGTVALHTGAGRGSAFELAQSSNMSRAQFGAALDRIHEHIVDGDAFQVVFSQRFERWSAADPFSTYRALRVINPSPYMIYMQGAGSTLVASSPEILCRVVDRVVTNRPLAGTRPRGRTPEEDAALEAEMLADAKDCAEHTMLVDLGRNDVGRVAEYGTVQPSQLMEVERYSNVMHISSTVTGRLRPELASWDALRAQLPVGTISGAPKIRAMQIIDALEPTRRGPYGGGIGYISFQDTMNMALALRTMVVPHATRARADGTVEWRYHLQAGAGIVLDSDSDLEYAETINKAMALNRAIDLAENAFGAGGGGGGGG
jgi:anthranilate synthase component I